MSGDSNGNLWTGTLIFSFSFLNLYLFSFFSFFLLISLLSGLFILSSHSPFARLHYLHFLHSTPAPRATTPSYHTSIVYAHARTRYAFCTHTHCYHHCYRHLVTTFFHAHHYGRDLHTHYRHSTYIVDVVRTDVRWLGRDGYFYHFPFLLRTPRILPSVRTGSPARHAHAAR